MPARFGKPEPLADGHDLSHFCCDDAVLDLWLRERALNNQRMGHSRTFVVTDDGARVVGFYCLSAHLVERLKAGDEFHGTDPPRSLTAILLGRMGVQNVLQGEGLGGQLVRDAIARTVLVASHIGARLMAIDAKTPELTGYYVRFGFKPAQPGSLLMLETTASLSASTSQDNL